MSRAALALGLALGLGAACADASDAPAFSAAAATLVLDEAAGRVWVTSPDDDALVAHDATTLEEVARFAVAGAPEALARAGDRWVVTRAQSSSVAVVSADGAVTDVPTPCGGTDAVVVAEGAAYVSCPYDARVLVLALDAPRVTQVLAVSGEPRGLAINGDGLAIARPRVGRVTVVSRSALAAAGAEVEVASVTLDERSYHRAPGIAASRLSVVVPAGAGFAALHQEVDHDSDRARPPEQGGYGAVIDAQPRIAPRVAADGCGASYARFDGSARVASGPSALAYAPASGTLWVAHQSTDNVLVLDCAPTAEGPRAPIPSAGDASVRAAFTAGRGPRGIALSADGRTAWVDLGFAHAVARWSLDDGAGRPATVRTRAVGPRRWLSERAEAGRALFFDATNTHLTPSGVVTCGTCHPAGGDDGLSWFLHTRRVARKLRRTPPAWAAKAALAPYHWDGEFADASTLARAAIVELMEGDALVVELASIAAYMDEQPPPPPRPVDPAARRAGRAVFEAAGCAECHDGPLAADGRRHAVLSASADADGALAEVDTPTLRAVRARPPFGHDGRAESLRALLTSHNVGDTHGRTSSLSPAELDRLIDYLESL